MRMDADLLAETSMSLGIGVVLYFGAAAQITDRELPFPKGMKVGEGAEERLVALSVQQAFGVLDEVVEAFFNHTPHN